MFKLRSGFIVGGLVGAAAAMVFARKRPDAAARLSHAVTGIGSKLTGFAVSGMMNRSMHEAAKQVPKPSSDTKAHSGEEWGKLEALIESDPSVKQEVSRIKEEAASGPH
ncbi:hypothetical protein [Paenibacillus protaetiae]|uniref:Uncharacterized protein n=1 Tax=Paenibacillus protaetiae TaxID=2509456 RepID=A0A4P6F6Z5_9BACL|nr:hypothetical protein [Paenibacillus protaetiae]QAY66188.1 hypothetical protein ET464_07040 [Paenibacillus protaetiae]